MSKFYCTSKLSENIAETPEGYLLCLAVPIGRTGVMEYGEGETPLEVGDDGIVYVTRSAEELFRKQTMASFEGKSFTIKHPEEFVNPDNWKDLTKGTLHNVARSPELDEDGEEVLLADILITDKMAIGLVKSGLRELSCGYEAEYKQTGKGKGRQTNIVGNHLALVDEGRAGSTYAIRDHNRKADMKNKLKKMLTLISGGKTVDQAIEEVAKPKKKVAASAAAPTLDEKLKALTAQIEQLTKDGAGKKKKKVAATADGQGAEVTTFDAEAYGAMRDAYDAMGKQLDAMKPKEEESKDEEEEEESEDEGEDTEILERVKALEAAVAKLLETGDEDESEEEEESEDEESEEEEESEDEDLEGSEKPKKKTGDNAAAAAAAKTTKKKKTGLEGTKVVDAKLVGETFDGSEGAMTPEKMNEINAATWARK